MFSSLTQEQSFTQKVLNMNWGLMLLITLMAGVGVLCLYSAANGSFTPWASRHILRFIVCFIGMLCIALIDIRWWYRFAYIPFILGLLLLLTVEITGRVGMGAQRWIDLGFMQLQPSELMKIAIIMALAKYYNAIGVDNASSPVLMIAPLLIVGLPAGLVLIQPDLGTSVIIILAGLGVMYLAGVTIWFFLSAFVAGVLSLPVAWQFLHDYQKDRIMTFLNPESDPLGSGYHILQSKIALGSGGLEGKGFLKGTQSHLNFLPEKQTDFIFTLWAEEWGMLGGFALFLIIGLILAYCSWIALQCRQRFARLLAIGLTINFSLYAIINIAMVMGVIPVVGVPLPLISYGGTSMLAVMISFGLMMSCYIHRDRKLQAFF